MCLNPIGMELMNRYTMSAPLSDCEAIIKAVLEKPASAAETARQAEKAPQ